MLKVMRIPYVFAQIELCDKNQAASLIPQKVQAVKTGQAPQKSSINQAAPVALSSLPHRPLPISAKPSIEEMTSAMLACDRCALHQDRQSIDMQDTRPQAAWMFISSSPVIAKKEGSSLSDARALLEAMWKALNIPLSQVTLTSAVKCITSTERAPTLEEMQQCIATYLPYQIHCLQPQVLVVMGVGAAHAMGLVSDKQTPLGKLRQIRHEFSGIPAIVTYPLDFLLRHPQEKAKLWEDLCLAASCVSSSTRPS